MAVVRIVENPRRKSRRKRRTLSAKQRSAGFGGKRTMSRRGRSTTKRRTKRRRNPLMASLGNPRRRASNRRRPLYTVTGVARRRRKNPRIGPFNIDVMTAVYIGSGILSVELLPRAIKKLWLGLPTVGLPGYGVKAAVALGTGYLVGRFTNSRNGALVTAGGLSMIFVDLFRQYALPRIPYLSGLANDSGTVSAADLSELYGYVDAPGVSGYINQPTGGFGEYVENPVGGY